MMNDILVGKEVADYLQKERFFKNRREAVQYAWADYLIEVYDRVDKGDPEPYKYGYDDLGRQTEGFVKREAERWALKNSKKYRLGISEFESEFRVIVLNAALVYKGEGFFFYYLRRSIKNAALNLIDYVEADIRRFDYQAVSLEEQYQEVASVVDVAQIVEAKIIVEQLEKDSSLSDKERRLLELLKRYPDASNQELSDLMDLGHREKVRRLKLSLRRKGLKYFEAEKEEFEVV